MKRANREGSIRQRPDGRWEARYTAGRDPGTGKQRQRSVYGATQAEVARQLREACKAVDDGIYIEPSKLTVGQWLTIWLDEYCGNLKMYSIRNYRSQVDNRIRPALGAVKLNMLSAHMIQKTYNALLKGDAVKKDKPSKKEDAPAKKQRKPKEGPLSPKTVCNIHGILHKALAQAVALGYIRINPADACTLPRVKRKDITPLDDAQITAFLEALKGHRYENLFLVDLFTGMRQGEILGLQWACVDFDQGTIRIDKQLYQPSKGGGYTFETLKNDKARTLAPAPFVVQALKDERKKQLAARLRAGEVWDEGKLPGLVFTNAIGGHLTHGTIYNQYKRIVAQVGIPTARFHDLRHSYAVASLRSGDDVKTVQENLGHHTAAFTLDQYGHVTEAMKRDSAARMEAYIQSLDKGQK